MLAAISFLAVHQLATGDMRATLPSGQSIHLIAVAQNGRKWSPKGGPAPLRKYLDNLSLDPAALLFVLEYQRAPSKDYPRLALQLPPKGKVTPCRTNTIDFSSPRDRKDRATWYAIGGSSGASTTADHADLRVGYAYGQWRTADTIYVRHGKILSGHSASRISHFGESVAQKTVPDVRFQVELPNGVASSAVRIVTFDRHGRTLNGHGSMALGTKTEYHFQGPASNVSRIEVQTQPYTWVVFKAVILRPQSLKERI